MKSILISIKPKYVAKILNGEKTIEIRKTMPQCDLPIDVYIYCTKDKEHLYRHFDNKFMVLRKYNKLCSHNGKVVAKFTLNKVEKIELNTYFKKNQPYETDTLCERFIQLNGCLTGEEYINYSKGKPTCGWVIDDLVIFDKPKELSKFCGVKQYFVGCESGIDKTPRYAQLTKAPQSWCYIETGE